MSRFSVLYSLVIACLTPALCQAVTRSELNQILQDQWLDLSSVLLTVGGVKPFSTHSVSEIDAEDFDENGDHVFSRKKAEKLIGYGLKIEAARELGLIKNDNIKTYVHRVWPEGRDLVDIFNGADEMFSDISPFPEKYLLNDLGKTICHLSAE